MLTEFIKVFRNLFICLRTDLYIHYSVHTVLLSFFALSYYVSLYSEFCAVKSVTISAYKRCSVRACFQLFVGGACLVCVNCVCLRTVVSNTYRSCFCFVFLHFVYPVLPDPLDCFFLLSLQWSLIFILIHKSYNVKYKFDKYNWYS